MIAITTRYKNQELQLLQDTDEQRILWETHPVNLRPSEERAINMERVISVISGKTISPSARAGFSDDQIVSPVITMLDEDHEKSIKSYKASLRQAEAEDRKSIAANQGVRIYENYYGFSWAWKLFGSNFLTQEQYDRDAQARRYTWMVEVNMLEKQRLDRIELQIKRAVDAIETDLKVFAKRNQVDVEAASKAFQLKEVYNAHFSDGKLVQDEALTRLLPLRVLPQRMNRRPV